MKQKQKNKLKKERRRRNTNLTKSRSKKREKAYMKTLEREKQASTRKKKASMETLVEVAKIKAKRREEAKPIKKYKNTTFLLDTNTILDRERYKENILVLMKGANNKILISDLVLKETRKHEKTSTRKSLEGDLTNLFGDRVEFDVITNQMKAKGEELVKKHQPLGLHHPDCYILAQATMKDATVITADQALLDSCKAEQVHVHDQREHVQKKPKKKKAKAIKPEKKYSMKDIEEDIR